MPPSQNCTILPLIGKEFPLWDVHNTLLMDDSPDKCTNWHENAIHPPSLTGRIAKHEAGESVTEDEENQRQQMLFFEGLIDFWKLHAIKQSMDRDGDRFNSPKITSEVTGMVQYLREHAVGHMGFRF